MNYRAPMAGLWNTRVAATFILVMTTSQVPASGQEASNGNAEARSFWVTEAAYSYSVAGPCSDHYPSFEVGKLRNVNGSMAAGAAIFVGHNAAAVFGPQARLRYWASEDIAFDLAGGALWGASRARPSGSVSVNYRDLVSVLVRYEQYRDGGCGQPTENQIFVGFKIGSRPGIITGIAGSVLGGIIILAVISGIEN